MLPPEEVAELTGHPVGGVCPFGLAQPLPVYLDSSLRDFDEVLPAASAIHSAVRISPTRMATVTNDGLVSSHEARKALNRAFQFGWPQE